MRSYRFSLSTLMSAVFIAALACSLFRFAAGALAGLCLLVPFGLFIHSIRQLRSAPDEDRPFWWGVVLSGCGYLLFVSSGLLKLYLSSGGYFPTEALVWYIHHHTLHTLSGFGVHNLSLIVHSLSSLFVALLGGWAIRFFARRQLAIHKEDGQP